MDTFLDGVSICVFTYNFQEYLRQALESILQQNCNFPIQIIIGDDCSTDNTRTIAESYQKKYPEIIKLSFNEKNIGGARNWIETISKSKRKYISLLDGDDFFCDNLKLQKQYNALEQNLECVLCMHSVREIYETDNKIDEIIEFEKNTYTIEDILKKGWFIRTGSVFFRNGILPMEFPEWVFDYPYRFDTILQVFLCTKGYIVNLKEVMSVWRKHDKGMSLTFLQDKIENIQNVILLTKQLNSYTNKKYERAVNFYLSELNTYLFIFLLKSRKWWINRKNLLSSFRRMSFLKFINLLQKRYKTHN